MTDIMDRVKTMIGVIDHSREQAVQHAYSDRVYQDALAELVAEVEKWRAVAYQQGVLGKKIRELRAEVDRLTSLWRDDQETAKQANAALERVRALHREDEL